MGNKFYDLPVHSFFRFTPEAIKSGYPHGIHIKLSARKYMYHFGCIGKPPSVKSVDVGVIEVGYNERMAIKEKVERE